MNKKLLVLFFVLLAGCSSKEDRKPDGFAAFSEDPDYTPYEVMCVTEPPAEPINPNEGLPLPTMPETLPVVNSKINVSSCEALGSPPRFFDKKMQGLAAVVDCTTKTVLFRTNNVGWEQANERAGIAQDGSFHLDIMYIVRLMKDIDGDENCWTRILGHIDGHAVCSTDPAAIRISFETKWNFDQTPASAMEPATPGLADHRNGKQCVLREAPCEFTNSVSMGCSG